MQLYLRARITDIQDDGGTKLVVARSTPPVRGGNALEQAFEAIARRTGTRTPTVVVDVTSDIPMAAGLGSSAAATVAGLRIFERVAGRLPDSVLLGAATAAEGHADNAAPALFGGLNSVMEVEGSDPVALRWRWPGDLWLVVATPTVGLATAKARAALPDTLPRRDAIYNLQRVLSLVHALQQGDYGRLREAVKDRWHQPARASLVPLLEDALAIEDPDVLGAFLSGAGPSIAFLARPDQERREGRPAAAGQQASAGSSRRGATRHPVDGAAGRVERVVSALYERAGVEAAVRTLSVHEEGELVDAVASAPEGTPSKAFRETGRTA